MNQKRDGTNIMKAKKVYERLDFERGQDPKVAMGIGQQAKDKKHLIQMMTDPATYASSEDKQAEYKHMLKIIMDPKTKVRFEKKHEDKPGNSRILIIMPPSLTNVFFFESLGSNIARNNDVEAYHWDNPTENSMNIWINSENNN